MISWLWSVPQTIGDFLPKSEKKPFENDRYLVETEPPRESTVAREFPLTVHQKAVSGMGNSVGFHGFWRTSHHSSQDNATMLNKVEIENI